MYGLMGLFSLATIVFGLATSVLYIYAIVKGLGFMKSKTDNDLRANEIMERNNQLIEQLLAERNEKKENN
ncbi:hypothetical protein [Chengkuizengella sediminis]|uniref:hypothetical protein n=1 Tax=Chengkuizengella sediminis TaxID=1885917 RepID=UPI00138A0A1C|nr:hypothetical protein [Chengkuizengella sediminis]NDI37185.1 hypothetical protein [Chengkuizengella sediminis]